MILQKYIVKDTFKLLVTNDYYHKLVSGLITESIGSCSLFKFFECLGSTSYHIYHSLLEIMCFDPVKTSCISINLTNL